MNAHRNTLSSVLANATLGDGKKLDRVSDSRRFLHVCSRHGRDAFDCDVVDTHAGVEGQGGQDRALGGRVEPIHVGGRVGLGESEFLRLGEGLLVAEPLGIHRVQDEVRRPVDDSHHHGDAVARERLAQAVDDGHGSRDRRLVVEVGTIVRRGLVKLRAVRGEERLVAGHHRDPLAEGAQNEGACRFDATDELNDDVHGIDCLGGLRRQQLPGDRRVTRCVHIADKHPTNLRLRSRARGEILAARLQDANDLATDGSGAEDANCEDWTGCRHGVYSLVGWALGQVYVLVQRP